MLVLSRKKQESITIFVPKGAEACTIVISLQEVRGDKARIGIDAPKTFSAVRTELMDPDRAKDTESR